MRDRLRAFVDGGDLRVTGAESGPLSGTTFVVKDTFDVAGQITGCGNPDWARTHPPAGQHATAVARLLAAGACLVGKTHMDELAYGLNGENHHYGTPINPRADGRIPGGSSSGSAVAVAGGLSDFSLGTDTGGSVRIPASYCGLYGIRPTHGRVAAEGCVPLAPSFDTVGWFARDPMILKTVGDVLLDPCPPFPVHVTGLVVIPEAQALVDDDVAERFRTAVRRVAATFDPPRSQSVADDPDELLACADRFRVLQGIEVCQVHGEWIRTSNPEFGPGVGDRFRWAASLTQKDVAAAAPTRARISERLHALLEGGHVALMPTTPTVAPPLRLSGQSLRNLRRRILALSCLAGFAGLPQVSLPLPDPADGTTLPVGLSLLGAPGSDAALLELAARVAAVLG